MASIEKDRIDSSLIQTHKDQEREPMSTQEWNMEKLTALSGSYWNLAALQAGVKLDVFTNIGNEKLPAETIAKKMNADKRALSMLLNALSAMGFLVKSGDLYENSKASATFLSKDSPQYVGYIIMHHYHLVESWHKLDQAILTGKPVRARASHEDEAYRENFLMGMFNNAMAIAPKIIKNIDLSDKQRLLDFGGGPGTYAIHFCMENPELEAVVFDLSTTRPFAEKTIKKFDLSDRIQFIGGNFLEDDVEGVFDVAWLSHILHAESPADCQRIVDKAVSCLKPGGIILIHEFILNDSMDSPLFPALFSLNMLLGTSGGQAYSETQIAGMLETAGVKDIHRIFIETLTHSGIMRGTV